MTATCVYLCLPVSTCLYLCLPVSPEPGGGGGVMTATCVYLCLPVSTCAYLCLPVSTCVSLCPQSLVVGAV